MGRDENYRFEMMWMTIFLFVGASFSRKLGQVCLGKRERLRLSLSRSTQKEVALQIQIGRFPAKVFLRYAT